MKRSEKKKKSKLLFLLGMGSEPAETTETIITKKPGGEGKQRRVSTSREMIYGWERGGLYLQLNMVS